MLRAFALAVVGVSGVVLAGVITNQVLSDSRLSWTWAYAAFGAAGLIGLLVHQRKGGPTGAKLGRWRRVYLWSLRSSVERMETVGIITQSEYIPRMRDVYVDVRMEAAPLHVAAPESYVGRPAELAREPRSLRSVMDWGRGRVFVVLGGPGSGKTTMLRVLALALCDRNRPFWRWSPLPVLIYLREHRDMILADEAPELSEVAVSVGWLAGMVPARWLKRRLDQGGCLVLLDGLDEIADAADRSRFVVWVKQQTRRYPGNTYVVTSRPHGYLNNPLPDAEVLRLRTFSAEQISRYLHNWYEAVEQRAVGLEDARNSARAAAQAEDLELQLRTRPELLALAANPLLLTMIANVHRYRGALPGSRADLYAEICDVLIHRRQEAKGVVDVTGLRGGQKERVVRHLALAMMTARVRDVSAAEAKRILWDPLLQVASHVHPEDFLEEVRRSGLLVEVEYSRYAFAHITLQEYLAAAQIGQQPGLVDHLIANVDDNWWRETTVLWASFSDASPVVAACLEVKTATALSLAVECAEQALELSPELRHALDAVNNVGLDLPDRSGHGTTASINAFVDRSYGPRGSWLDQSARRVAGLLAAGRSLPAEDGLAAVVRDVQGRRARPGPRQALTPITEDERVLRLLVLAAETRTRRSRSAIDLYLAALSLLNGEDGPVGLEEVLRRLVAVIEGVTPKGADQGWAEGLRRLAATDEPAVFDLLLELLAEEGDLGELVLSAICDEPGLRAAAVAHFYLDGPENLRNAWLRAAKEWSENRWWLVHGLGALERLTLSKSGMASALETLAEYRDRAPEYLGDELSRIAKVLLSLQDFVGGRTFDEKEGALRSALRVADALGEDIRLAPTTLSVEVVEPVRASLHERTKAAYRELIENSPPLPEVSVALVRAAQDHSVIVQVKVANAEGRAAVEAATVLIDDDLVGFRWTSSDHTLPAPVRGGTSQIVVVRLEPADLYQGIRSFTLPVTLSYRTRLSKATALLTADLQVRVPASGDFAEVPNPYLDWASGRPVDRPDMFFGRDELINRARERFRSAAGPGAGLAIFGQRRAGKSSIRLQLVRRLREDGLPVADIGNIGELTPSRNMDPTRLLALLMWRIVESADKVLPGEAPLLPPDLRRADFLASPDPVFDCTQIFDGYRRAVPRAPSLIVTIDEFQYLQTWISQGLAPAAFLTAFKALVERRLFHLVIVGQSAIERLVRDDPNVFGVFSTERVSRLAPAPARRLIEWPIRLDGQTRHREGAVARILDLTGGNAFFIQRLCADLVEYMNEERAPLVTQADVDLVAQDFIERLTGADFDHLESHDTLDFSSADQRAALVAIARAGERGQATLDAVAHEYGGTGLRELLRHLVAHEVVQHDEGSYRIVVGLYREWLLKYMGAS
ncbi:hypothetical protein GCM10009527_014270 [Actinomadura nitritigenes]